MKPGSKNSFKSLSKISINNEEYKYYSLKKAEETNQPQKCIMNSRGYDTSGVCVSEFRVTWSIKKR